MLTQIYEAKFQENPLFSQYYENHVSSIDQAASKAQANTNFPFKDVLKQSLDQVSPMRQARQKLVAESTTRNLKDGLLLSSKTMAVKRS